MGRATWSEALEYLDQKKAVGLFGGLIATGVIMALTFFLGGGEAVLPLAKTVSLTMAGYYVAYSYIIKDLEKQEKVLVESFCYLNSYVILSFLSALI